MPHKLNQNLNNYISLLAKYMKVIYSGYEKWIYFGNPLNKRQLLSAD